MSTASGKEEEMEHVEMAEVTTVEDEEKTTSDSNDDVGDSKMPLEDVEKVSVLHKEDFEENVECGINPTKVIVIDDDEEGRIEDDAIIVEVEDVEDNNMDYEEDDDVLMDDEDYTPLDEAGNTSYSPQESEAESNAQSSLGSSFEFDLNFATVLRNANVPCQRLNARHQKSRHLNNMEIVHTMVAKGKVVNPADEEEKNEEGSKDDTFFNPRETKILEQTERVWVCTEKRSEDYRSGTEIVEIPEGKALKSKVMILGGEIPIKQILAPKRLNEEVEKFRYDLQKHKQCWDNVVFKYPQRKVGWKVDPSTILPKKNDEKYPAAAAGGAASTPSLVEVLDVVRIDEYWDGKIYPKPPFYYPCLIALALKNTKTGALPVSEIYKFISCNFPYYDTAPNGWKNSIRHSLSHSKWFLKYGERPPGKRRWNSKKNCQWTLNPTEIHKIDMEVRKKFRKYPTSITIAMRDPENLGLIERGELKRD